MPALPQSVRLLVCGILGSMFLFFGHKKSVKPVRGGRQVVTECPGCGVRAKFLECEQKNTLDLYTVLDLYTEKKTVFRCTNCGDVFELDEDAARASLGDAERQRETRREQRERAFAADKRQAELRRQEREREREKQRRTDKIESELAALKAKLRSD